MLTKGAIGNLVNRYRAVLAKCNLINTFGSLAVAAALVLAHTGLLAELICIGAHKVTLGSESLCSATCGSIRVHPPSRRR